MDQKTLMIVATVALILVGFYVMYNCGCGKDEYFAASNKCPPGQTWCSIPPGYCLSKGQECIDINVGCMPCCESLNQCIQRCSNNSQCISQCGSCSKSGRRRFYALYLLIINIERTKYVKNLDISKFLKFRNFIMMFKCKWKNFFLHSFLLVE